VEDADDLRQWERKALAGLIAMLVAVLGLWAGVVWSGTDKVLARLEAMSAQLAADRLEQERYRSLTERRLTIIEQRQQYVIEAMRNNHAREQVIVP
jgi:hypothetical protein